MLILKLTIDEVTADGIDPDLESSLTVTSRDVLPEGVETLCADVLRHLDADAAGPLRPVVTSSEVAHRDDAPTVTAVDTAGTGPFSALTPREMARLRMTVDNEDARVRAGRFDAIASADDLALVLPLLRKLLAAYTD